MSNIQYKVTAKSDFAKFEQLVPSIEAAEALKKTLIDNGWYNVLMTPYSQSDVDREMQETLNSAIDSLNQLLDVPEGEYEEEEDYNSIKNKKTFH